MQSFATSKKKHTKSEKALAGVAAHRQLPHNDEIHHIIMKPIR
jgi:hypothetical protein